jgi:hypothetical protein
MKYTLLHGAKENAGDFYIRDSAINIITDSTKSTEDEIYSIDIVRNSLTNARIKRVADTEVAFLAGGPGYGPNFYPDIYPEMKNILKATTVVPLGPGWRGKEESEYNFTPESQEVLKQIASQSGVPYLGARDLPTVRILRSHDIPAKLTGCPGWYLPGVTPPTPEFESQRAVKRIITSSPPVNHPKHLLQWFVLIRKLENRFPGADMILAFHRSESKLAFRPSIGNPLRMATWRSIPAAAIYRIITWYATQRGHEIWDVPADSTYAKRYAKTDFHAGYRVHAHIPALAAGTPSYLLQIDGRGTGVSESLGTPADVRSDIGRTKAVHNLLQNIGRNIENGHRDFDSVETNVANGYANMKDLVTTVVN